MLDHALAFCFQIHTLTPPKAAYVGLCLLNVALMLTLAWRSRTPFFRLYLLVMAGATMLQNSPVWNMALEVNLATFTALWVIEMLPEGRRGKVEALSLGAVVGFALMFLGPDPWPHYSHAMYFVRMYSSAVGMGTALVCAFDKRRFWAARSAIPWFAAVLLAQSQRGWDVWTVGITANLIWTACLVAWLVTASAARVRLRAAPAGRPSS